MTKAESPIPSMVNYPEPAVGETVNKLGFNSKGIRYKVTGNSQQTDSSSEDQEVSHDK